MFIKTSAIKKNKYFQSLQTNIKRKNSIVSVESIFKKEVASMTTYDLPIYLTALSGIATLIVSDNIHDTSSFRQFILHGTVKIYPGIYFNYLSVSSFCQIEVSRPNHSVFSSYSLNQPILMQEMEQNLLLSKIYTLYYQAKKAPYAYRNDQHPYCELTIVENGQLDTTVDGKRYHLKQNDVMLYQSNQLHSQYVNTESVTTYITIMFEMKTDDERFFNRTFHLNSRQLSQMENLIDLSNQNPSLYQTDALIANLKLFILSLLTVEDAPGKNRPQNSMKEKYDNEVFQKISDYIRANPKVQVTDIVNYFGISRSSLQILFRRFTTYTPKAYIEEQRLKQAKLLIQESSYSLAEIANLVGYNSIQSFSRAFKNAYNLSPSQYAKQIYKGL